MEIKKVFQPKEFVRDQKQPLLWQWLVRLDLSELSEVNRNCLYLQNTSGNALGVEKHHTNHQTVHEFRKERVFPVRGARANARMDGQGKSISKGK